MMENKINRDVLQKCKTASTKQYQRQVAIRTKKCQSTIQTFNKQVNVEKDVFSEHKKDNRS